MVEKFSLEELEEKFKELTSDIEKLKENNNLTLERVNELESIFDLIFARMMVLRTEGVITKFSNHLKEINSTNKTKK